MFVYRLQPQEERSSELRHWQLFAVLATCTLACVFAPYFTLLFTPEYKKTSCSSNGKNQKEKSKSNAPRVTVGIPHKHNVQL
jgi:hypothetical protein